MCEFVDWRLPIKTVSEFNCREHWRVAHKRHKAQKALVAWQFLQERPKIELPCVVKLTRIAPGTLDFDNLAGSFKYITDAVCDGILPGLRADRADGDPRIKIEYAQEKGKQGEYAVRIEIKNPGTAPGKEILYVQNKQ